MPILPQKLLPLAPGEFTVFVMADGLENVTVRPATLDDAERIRDLINEVDLVDVGFAEYSLAEVIEDMTAADTSLSDDSWLAFVGDRLVSYGIVWNEHRSERIDVDHYVVRDAVAIGEYVLDLVTHRCGEIAAENGVDTAIIHLNLTPVSALAQGVLAEGGWQIVRRHNVMKKSVSADTDHEPVMPSGVTVRHPRVDEKPIVHRVLQQAFAAHFDHHPLTYDEWLEQGRDRYEEQLSWIASFEGEDVGVLLSRNNRDAMGWVRALGVLPHARGRGVASTLLRLAFAAFAGIGRHTVGLGVDTQNVTNALHLYENRGMVVHFTVDTWEKTVPARQLASESRST